MAMFMECFDLEFLTETEEMTEAFVRYVLSEGKPITGYTGDLYINLKCGDSEFMARNIVDHENERVEFIGMDTHSSGRAVWDVRISGINLKDDEEDDTLLKRRLVVKNKDTGDGMAVVNIVNADVLPSFLEDDIINLQMVAFARKIDYFADEDAYADSIEKGKDGKKMLLADGFIFPSGMLLNRNPNGKDYAKNNWMDDHVVIKGVVKHFYPGKTTIGGVECDDYVICVIDTSFGELELIHSIGQVDENQRDNMRAGAVVSGVFVLSGDAAIDDYENGIVKDEEHHLRLLRHVLTTSEDRRLNGVFADDAVYVSDWAKESFIGKQSVIERFEYLSRTIKSKRFAHMATITEIKNDTDEKLPYEVGKRCLVMAYDEPDNYESICFIDMDKDNNISRIHFCQDSRYFFRVDKKFVAPEREFEYPDNFFEPMLARAKYFDFIDEETEYEDVMAQKNRNKDTANLAKYIVDNHTLFCTEENFDSLETDRNLFGYSFVYGIKMVLDKAFTDENEKFSDQYRLTDAVNGNVAEQDRELFEKARGFYNDYGLYVEGNNFSDEEIDKVMTDSMEFVLKLGQLCAEKNFMKEKEKAEETGGETENIKKFYFHDAYEFATYITMNKDKDENSKGVDTVWKSPDRYIEQYQKGFALFEKGDYLAAIDEYKKCFVLNPIAIFARFEICESYIKLGAFDKAKEELKLLSCYIVKKNDAARLYRRYGFIAIEEEKYSLAVACMRYSLGFEKNENAVHEEKYVEQLTKRKYMFLNITKEFKIHSIPMLKLEDMKDE
ncbi:MAG: tetratricopeptide repeat protein [Oscillospiraceae bacterium]|nr:tetratricopeptide repeat protein [Oscillospiraceae bacterium]